jgi:hypothetical protein
MQVFINKQAEDRAARSELANVFASDAAFQNLSVSTVHLKVVNVTITGPLPRRGDLDRLRERIFRNCPAVHSRTLHWEIRIESSGERVDGLDSDLFPKSDES